MKAIKTIKVYHLFYQPSKGVKTLSYMQNTENRNESQPLK